MKALHSNRDQRPENREGASSRKCPCGLELCTCDTNEMIIESEFSVDDGLAWPSHLTGE